MIGTHNFHKPFLPLIVAGSRTFNDYPMLKAALDGLLAEAKHLSITIISGGAQGADTLGEQYAKERGFSLLRVPALWDYYGRQAGYLRNRQMAYIAKSMAIAHEMEFRCGCVCFWDGQSRGTKHMLDAAVELELKTFWFHTETGEMTKLYPTPKHEAYIAKVMAS